MKRFFSRVCSLTLVLLLLLSLSSVAFAASIRFEGFSEGFVFEPGSEYTETDLFDGFKNVMPGDVLTETITFTNAAQDCDFVQLYMRAKAHDETDNPLSERVAEVEDLAGMTDFLAQLSMKVWNGTELIFDASPDELDGLRENCLLGTFRSGETATLTVELTVPLSLGNEYAKRVGEVDWVFHIEAYNESQISVRKVWSDGNDQHDADSINVNLLRDGTVAESVELNADNGWAYTFDQLTEGYEWTVEEADVPEGYSVSYEEDGTSIVIVNTKDTPTPPPEQPLDLIVQKVWSNDDSAERPESVTVTLYDGTEPYETVVLNEGNNWTYHWLELSAKGNWQVVETNIPKGYTPSYRVSDNLITITNTRKLIQTGQLQWPILVLCAGGFALVALGGAILLSKRKRADA